MEFNFRTEMNTELLKGYTLPILCLICVIDEIFHLSKIFPMRIEMHRPPRCVSLITVTKCRQFFTIALDLWLHLACVLRISSFLGSNIWKHCAHLLTLTNSEEAARSWLSQMHCADSHHCPGDQFKAACCLAQSVSGGNAAGLESKAWTNSNQNA